MMAKKQSDPGRYIVAWSGGLDSTALLHWYATTSSEAYQVVAVSVIGHPNLNKFQLSLQNKAQARFLKYAKSKGYHIEHRKIKIGGSGIWDGPSDGTGQPILWALAIAASLRDNDTVLMGYICKDDFWHYKHQFLKLFNAICEFKGVKATIEFPFEWVEKAEVIDKIAKVPKNCWFSCDRTNNNKPCGICKKCLAIQKCFAKKQPSIS